MAILPKEVSEAWENRQGPIILTTVDKNGAPNAIYATCTAKYGDDTIVIANNYFSKTLDNILAGCRGSVLFITQEGTSYQIKGHFEYHKEGAIYDDMKKWNPQEHPGHAAAALKVEQVFSGAKKLL